MNRGLLLTMTEPPAAMEEEFNAWYDDEHMAERLGIKGFRSARRWVADVAPGEGKYLATYELDSPGVLQSAEYLARFQNQTPWSRRCLGKAVVFRRWACEQTRPGDADPRPEAKFLFCVIADSPIALTVTGALQLRHFAAGQSHIALAELSHRTLPPVDAGWETRLYRAYAP
jgi:hypothetical protein